MQKCLIILLITIFQISQMSGQILEIFPENPSTNDCIYIYTEAVTSNLAYVSNSNIEEDGNNFTIDICYTEGSANAIGYYNDTIALGFKEAGVYQLNYLLTIARRGATTCDDAEQTSTQLTFEVIEDSSVELPCHELEVNIFPNPIRDSDLVRMTASETISRIDVFDAAGKFVYGRNRSGNSFVGYSPLLFPVSGIYFVQINGNSENSVTTKVVKY